MGKSMSEDNSKSGGWGILRYVNDRTVLYHDGDIPGHWDGWYSTKETAMNVAQWMISEYPNERIVVIEAHDFMGKELTTKPAA
jgi:hypothetical protein